MKELISEYPVTIEIPVAWADMDAFQHVNNVVYFKHFESARISYFERIKYFEVMNDTGVGPILASTHCKYKIPLTYPDQVTVGAKVETIEEERFKMKYAVISHNHQKVAALGEGMIVSFDYRSARKTPIPEEIRKRIAALEKSVGHNLRA